MNGLERSNMEEQKKHTWTDEKIYHFTCGFCKNWWSYAGFFHNWKHVMTCPHCGLKAECIVKPRFKEDT